MASHLKHPVVSKMRQLAYRNKRKGLVVEREKLRNHLKQQGHSKSIIDTALSVYHLHSGGMLKGEPMSDQDLEKTFGGIKGANLPTQIQHITHHPMGQTLKIPSSKGLHEVSVVGIDHKNKQYKLKSTKTGKSGTLSFDVAHKIKKPGA